MSATAMLASSIPYGFAKRYGVFVQSKADEKPVLCYQTDLSPRVYAEVRRMLGRSFECRQLDVAEFESSLITAY
jgi:general secretion pathway protein E